MLALGVDQTKGEGVVAGSSVPAKVAVTAELDGAVGKSLASRSAETSDALSGGFRVGVPFHKKTCLENLSDEALSRPDPVAIRLPQASMRPADGR